MSEAIGNFFFQGFYGFDFENREFNFEMQFFVFE
jgi:hypothetical protein